MSTDPNAESRARIQALLRVIAAHDTPNVQRQAARQALAGLTAGLDRTERAWFLSQDWVADADDSANRTAFVAVPLDGLGPALHRLQASAPDLTFRPLWNELPPGGEDQPVAVAEAVDALRQGQLSNLAVLYDGVAQGFGGRVQIYVEPVDEQAVDVQVVWWPRQVFPPGVDQRARFGQVFAHLAWLQTVFGSDRMYFAPHTWELPGPDSPPWFEV
jgi:hypothetical protein